MTAASRAEVLEALAADHRLRGFLRDGRLARLPARQSPRRLLLEQVCRAFEPGVRYRESAVNEVLRAIHPDYAALRRYLVDSELLAREAGEYWRIGGPVDLSPR